eukprot:CAMPEP_0116853284 /NCGR_PEP_ID=MMETSP0418-20121206/17821_1 /TAXON_ID=1158023 /ORGANISM="Astrosyne radiata, Strain 13vi08-1A" /LENGTH=398 /DNA_ID=CAMNT_0004485657 /DNA_START=35 /DNA_END=1231 /DNA_ORIENTATION=-
MTSSSKTKKKNPLQHLIAGGCAGFVESSICHPLDTIKTRMQLRRQAAVMENTAQRILQTSLVEPALRLQHSLVDPIMNRAAVTATTATANATANAANGLLYQQSHVHEPRLRMDPSVMTATTSTTTVQSPPPRGVVRASLGPFGTAQRIIQREGFVALYKGLSAVYTGIIPKMAIRFVSFEYYKELLNTTHQQPPSSGIVFVAGLCSGLTEAILVVTPAEVCKIRMQSQMHSLVDVPVPKKKYTNVFSTAVTVVREEGIGALYKGVIPTMLRQGCNQAVNFTAYQYFKKKVLQNQQSQQLSPWQSLVLGGISGGMGPLVNNPLDVVKTRLQKQVVIPGKAPKYTGLFQACTVIAKEEGVLALWKGITPRLLRIMPGQAITFMTYEAVNAFVVRHGFFA